MKFIEEGPPMKFSDLKIGDRFSTKVGVFIKVSLYRACVIESSVLYCPSLHFFDDDQTVIPNKLEKS
jgi:hypothetical protein